MASGKKVIDHDLDEIAMDLLSKIKNYDTVMLFSGDSDFGGLMDYLKNNGEKIIVVCTRI